MWAVLAAPLVPGDTALAVGGGTAPAVRVYVFTAEAASGEPSDEEKGRLDAVREVRDALAKKKELQIVNTRADADVLVEVMQREEEAGPQGGFGGKTITNMDQTVIRVRVSHASGSGEPSELKGMGQGTWGRAAKDLADRVLKWVQRDQPTPPHKRGKDMPPSTVMTLPVA
jgi:hypothetical protein